MVDLRGRGRRYTTSSTPDSTSATSFATIEGATCKSTRTYYNQHPPSPQQRVQFELLPDDTTSAQPTVPTITTQSQQQSAPLPPPPWTPFDIASVRGTAITATSAAFNNPATSDRATALAARINACETELQISRAYYASN
jgi:hypothetical protein